VRTIDSVIGGIRCPIFEFFAIKTHSICINPSKPDIFLLSKKSNAFSNKIQGLAIIVAIILLASPILFAQDFKVRIVDPLNRVGPISCDQIEKNSNFCEGNMSIKIAGARNEYEPFQFIISAQEEISGVRIEMTPLVIQTPSQTDTIPAESIKIYWEHYIYLAKSTPRSSLTFGWYPDALIPLSEIRDLTIKPNRNQPFWVDVHIPTNIKPGLYKGSIRISAFSATPIELPLELRVWNFTLPNPSLQTSFGLSYEEISNYHHLTPGSPEYWTTIKKYNEALIEHRLMPTCLLTPRALPDGSFDTTNLTPLFAYYFDTLQVNASMYAFNTTAPFADPLGSDSVKAKRYLSTYLRYLENHNWSERHYAYLIDEPDDSVAYQRVRDFGEFLHQVSPKIRILCTEPIEPQNPNWGNLYGYVDIYCPIFFQYDETQAHWRQSLGDEVWVYTACTQGTTPTPWWQLDMPLINYRIVPWQLRYYDISGLLYWSTNYWRETPDPWVKPAGFSNGRGDFWNGEGSLLYPGYNIGISGPVTSIRLKQLREGIEDYEYLRLLLTLGEERFAQEQIRRLTTSFYNWQTNPETLYEVRKTIGEKIDAINALTENDPKAFCRQSIIEISPNPFSNKLIIKRQKGKHKSNVPGAVKIYDTAGKLIKKFLLPESDANWVSWDGRDKKQSYVANGVYLVKIESDITVYQKVILRRK